MEKDRKVSVVRTLLRFLLVIIIGSCVVFDFNPFIIPIFIACYRKKSDGIITFLALILGSITGLQESGIRYIIVAFFALLSLCSGSRHVKLFSTVIMLLVNLLWVFLLWDGDGLLESLIEVLMLPCVTYIYENTIRAIENESLTGRMDGQKILMLASVAAPLYYGLPVSFAGRVNVADVAGLFMVLFMTTASGPGVGCVFAAVLGMLSGIKNSNSGFVIYYLLSAVITAALSEIIPIKKIAGIIGFSVATFSVILTDITANENPVHILRIFAAALVIYTTCGAFVGTDNISCERLKNGEMSGRWLQLILDRIMFLGDAFCMADYEIGQSREDNSGGVSFSDIGNAIKKYVNEFSEIIEIDRRDRLEIATELWEKKVLVEELIMTRGTGGHKEIFICINLKRGHHITINEVQTILEAVLNLRLLQVEACGRLLAYGSTTLAFSERPDFTIDIAVNKKARYKGLRSGDNYLTGIKNGGRAVMMISDGMGSGTAADRESMSLVNDIDGLLNLGFDREIGLRMVNGYVSRRNKGEIFATLDLFLMDLYTGFGRLYKQGAAASYIRRNNWIEVIESTSLPVGVCEDAPFEATVKKLYEGDMIVMMTDGVLESISFANGEDFIKSIIMEADSDSSLAAANDIMDEIMSVSGGRLNDDAMIIVGIIKKI